MSSDRSSPHKNRFRTVLTSWRRSLAPDGSRQQQASHTRRAPKSSGIDFSVRDRSDATAKRAFKVQVPTRLLTTVAGIFLLLPLSLFFWKELHLPSKTIIAEPVMREKFATRKDQFPAWMEDANLTENSTKSAIALDFKQAMDALGRATTNRTDSQASAEKLAAVLDTAQESANNANNAGTVEAHVDSAVANPNPKPDTTTTDTQDKGGGEPPKRRFLRRVRLRRL